MALPPPTSRQHQVYVNASLRFDSIEAIGFDMDYTLALYDSEALERLAFRMAVENLRRMGYPPEISDLEYRHGRNIRGLVVDKEAGNVVKMDRYHFVSIALHGNRELPRDERRRLYANRSIPLGTEHYTSVDTLFHMPEVDLFMQLVALKDAHPELLGPRSYRLLWNDMHHALDICHGDGSMKSAILNQKDTYLVVDPELPLALKLLRATGKRLFLLTNSEHYYTEAVMSHLFDGRLPGHERWTSYFDEVVVEARKPGYFLGYEDGKLLDSYPNPQGEARSLIEGGNYRELHRRLGCQGDQVLFVGDHIYGDVIRSKTHSFWRTMMVVPELDHELAVSDRMTDDVLAYHRLFERLGEHDHLRAALRHRLAGLERSGGAEDERTKVRQQLEAAEESAERMRLEVDAEENRIDREFHPHWGALFQDGGEVSRFGQQVAAYADIYTSRVANLARYPPNKWFHTPWEVLPHWRGHWF